MEVEVRLARSRPGTVPRSQSSWVEFLLCQFCFFSLRIFSFSLPRKRAVLWHEYIPPSFFIWRKRIPVQTTLKDDVASFRLCPYFLPPPHGSLDLFVTIEKFTQFSFPPFQEVSPKRLAPCVGTFFFFFFFSFQGIASFTFPISRFHFPLLFFFQKTSLAVDPDPRLSYFRSTLGILTLPSDANSEISNALFNGKPTFRAGIPCFFGFSADFRLYTASFPLFSWPPIRFPATFFIPTILVFCHFSLGFPLYERDPPDDNTFSVVVRSQRFSDASDHLIPLPLGERQRHALVLSAREPRFGSFSLPFFNPLYFMDSPFLPALHS